MNAPGHALEPVSGDAFRSLCDHVFWCNARPQENAGFLHGDIVFCKIDEVWRLFRALRRTRKRVVVVTGEGDKPVDEALWRRRPPHVFGWFGTNMQVQGDHAARGIPLGLGNAGALKTPSWPEINATAKSALRRDKLLYANFSAHSNPALRGSLLAWLAAPDQAWISTETHAAEDGRAAYLRALFSHRFVLCPPGNGEDTHRFWEALYCGAVPVIRRSGCMSYFTDLPVVMVDDFRDINRSLLESWIRPPNSDGCPSLRLDYWRRQFADAGNSAKTSGMLSWREWLGAWRAEFAAAIR